MSGRTWSPDDGLVSEMSVASRVPWSRRFVARIFQRLREGHVTLRDGWGLVQGGREDAEKRVQISVQDPRFYRRLVSGGGIGAAESYAQGEWNCADLTGLFRLLLRNVEVLGSVQQRRRGIARIIGSLRHWLKRNHRQGSRRNIHQHYDLGNEFFQLFLDETLNYSSAIFADPQQSLADASRNKMETICRKLELSHDDHVVEIGSGWGSLATWMAQQHGCRVTTTTISHEQFRYVSELVERLGLSDQVTVLNCDYRDMPGTYDKLVSVEMIEAVGHRYLPTFFQCCDQLLKPGGKMLLQAILTGDDHYQKYLASVDFIRAYIFPGGSLPCHAVIADSVDRLTALQIAAREDITPHYERTLQCWRADFENCLEQVRQIGFDERFIRIWRYYLCYCEAGFAERHSTTEQMLLVK